MLIRRPNLDEVGPIIALFADEVRAGRMLPRRAENIRNNLMDWWVAIDDGRVVGCASLVYFGWGLCEVRSLAVDATCRGQGIGSRLIEATLSSARAQGMRRVLTLTRAVGLFERAGFMRRAVSDFPEKVWRDCELCPMRQRCDEVALVYDVQHDED